MKNIKLKVFKKPIALGITTITIWEEEVKAFLYAADFSKGNARLIFAVGGENDPDEVTLKKLFAKTIQEQLQELIFEVEKVVDRLKETNIENLDGGDFDFEDFIDENAYFAFEYLQEFTNNAEQLMEYLIKHEEKVHPGQLSMEDYKDFYLVNFEYNKLVKSRRRK